MKLCNLKYDRGIAGANVLLGLIVTLFVIGLLVMIFALMGGSLAGTTSVSASETSPNTVQTSVALNDGAGTTLTACAASTNGAFNSFVSAFNESVSINSANFTFSGCTVTSAGDSLWNGSTIENLTYTYTHSGTAFDTINETTTSIAGVTDFFSLFIVIGAMVVLILLTVIIIVAIRQSGMLSPSSA